MRVFRSAAGVTFLPSRPVLARPRIGRSRDARGTTPRSPGTDRQPSQPSTSVSASGVITGLMSTVSGTGGASMRATRWLSEARLKIGDLKVSALFIAPVEKVPGDGLSAGCARLDPGVKPAVDAPLVLEGPPVRE